LDRLTKPVLVQGGEDGAHMSEMICPCLAVDEDVVEEDEDESAQVRPKNVVHERLERRRRVAEAERHHQELVEAVVGAERGFVHIFRPHPHLVVPGP